MKNVFKWDVDSESGYIVNTVYPKGYVFEDILIKPGFSFEYQSFILDFNTNTFLIIINDIKNVMSNEQRTEISEACMLWVDTTYVTVDTINDMKTSLISLRTEWFNSAVETISDKATVSEMASWRKQEEQALAYIDDSTALTPIIDAILSTRYSEYTKIEYCYLIVRNAEEYEVRYGELLGSFNKYIEDVKKATTIEELNLVK